MLRTNKAHGDTDSTRVTLGARGHAGDAGAGLGTHGPPGDEGPVTSRDSGYHRVGTATLHWDSRCHCVGTVTPCRDSRCHCVETVTLCQDNWCHHITTVTPCQDNWCHRTTTVTLRQPWPSRGAGIAGLSPGLSPTQSKNRPEGTGRETEQRMALAKSRTRSLFDFTLITAIATQSTVGAEPPLASPARGDNPLSWRSGNTIIAKRLVLSFLPLFLLRTTL